MSQQIVVRFHGNTPKRRHEDQLLGHAFQLFERLAPELGTENFLRVPYTSNEDALYDDAEEELADQGVDDEALDEAIEAALGQRGDFFDVDALLRMVSRYRGHFAARAGDTFDLDGRRRATGGDLAATLSLLETELGRGRPGNARFVIR